METFLKKASPLFNRPIGRRRPVRSVFTLLLSAFVLSAISCTQLKKPEPQPYFSENVPPSVQEFRWSNGKLPKSFDPALAAAPPETDIVRALYEGLTGADPSTLKEVPGVAESWSATDDFRIWTFQLRKDAKWSNGKPVTANDFVRSWKRLIKMGDKAAHSNLLSNIAGVPSSGGDAAADEAEQLLTSVPERPAVNAPVQQLAPVQSNSNSRPARTPSANSNTAADVQNAPGVVLPDLGIEAVDELTLKVTLLLPDEEFPRLVSHPIFRPIFNNGEEFVGKELNPTIVTNGPFVVEGIEPGGIILERSGEYWNRENVKLERVRIVAMESSEKALAAYRAGELDAITNASFSPLALKLLSPFEDFRKTTHSALNFYEVNTKKGPLSDRRVREALSNAIERERLTEGELEGLARPALGFLAFRTGSKKELTQDKEKAKDLLEEAGFPEGEGFPVIKLVINRNDTQQRVARSVAKMWKQNLNIETEIIVKEAAEVEQARKSGEFDLLRRGVVFPTSDEIASFRELFGTAAETRAAVPRPTESVTPVPTPDVQLIPRETPLGPLVPGEQRMNEQAPVSIVAEDEAIYELRAIPLYFPTSYSLIKPYVSGFQMNSLDILDLSNVTINSQWQPDADRS